MHQNNEKEGLYLPLSFDLSANANGGKDKSDTNVRKNW